MPSNPTVALSPELYEQCEQRIEQMDFNSVDEYVQFILSEVVKSQEGVKDDETVTRNVTEEQLKALGYLDR
jgi:Arc/MetJ-type ribon-helix-helix transcriptional regulator